MDKVSPDTAKIIIMAVAIALLVIGGYFAGYRQGLINERGYQKKYISTNCYCVNKTTPGLEMEIPTEQFIKEEKK